MTASAPSTSARPSQAAKILALWIFTVVLAVSGILLLQSYRDHLVTYLAFTSAPPSRKAEFTIELADHRFEALRREAAAAQRTGEGALSGDKRMDEVIALYRRALDFVGYAPNEAFYDKLAAAYSYAGDLDRMHQAQARSLLLQGAFAAAVDAAMPCVSGEGRVLLGQCLVAADRTDEAATLAERLEAERPGEVGVLQLRADIDNKRGRDAAARGEWEAAASMMHTSCQTLERVLKLDNENIATYSLLADQYRLLARYADEADWLDKAAVTLKRAIAVAPADAGLRHRLGLIQMEAGNTAEAVAALEKAVDIQPNSPGLLLDLRKAYLAAGQPTKAAPALQRALTLDPVWVERQLERK